MSDASLSKNRVGEKLSTRNHPNIQVTKDESMKPEVINGQRAGHKSRGLEMSND